MPVVRYFCCFLSSHFSWLSFVLLHVSCWVQNCLHGFNKVSMTKQLSFTFFLKKNLRNEGIDNKIKNDKILIFVVSF